MPALASVPTVLLLDDDPAIRASLHFSLELEGFQVDSFAAGETLLAMAELPAQACLVLDYRLPGVDGLKVLDELRHRGVSLPAVIMTSNPTRNLRRRVAEAGAMLIEKPLLCDALSASIRSLMDRCKRDTPADLPVRDGFSVHRASSLT